MVWWWEGERADQAPVGGLFAEIWLSGVRMLK